jgi:glucokinase
VDQIAADRVYALARQGDPIASEAFAITGAHLGRLLANLAVAFDPEAFVVAGGLARAGDALLVPAREAFQASRLSLLDRAVPILGSSLPDGDAPILGAACLLRRLPTPAPTLATL